MSNLAIVQPSQPRDLTRDQVDLIKRTIAKGCSDDELQLFVAACNRYGLDPFAKQIYAIKRGGAMTIQASIDGFRAIAEKTGRYAPGRATEYTETDGKVTSATAYVKKQSSDGTWHEVGETAHWAEYNGNNSMWQRMPHVMLAKCAESRALRRAFPAQLSGIYSTEEMAQAGGSAAPAANDDASLLPALQASVDAGIERARAAARAINGTVTVADLQGLARILRNLPADEKPAAMDAYRAKMAEIREAAE